MECSIFVGNLAGDTTEDDLRTLFTAVGTVTRARIITTNGTPRGYGFVDFEDPAHVQVAVERYDGHTLGERAINVSVAKPRQATSSRSRGRGRR